MSSLVDHRTLDACFAAAPFAVEVHDRDDVLAYANAEARSMEHDAPAKALRAALRASVRSSGRASEVTLTEHGQERKLWVGPVVRGDVTSGTITMERDLGHGLVAPGVAREALAAAPAIVAVFRGPSHVYEFVNERFVSAFPDFARMIGRSVAEQRGELPDEHFVERLDHVYRTGEHDEAHEVPVVLRRDGVDRVHYVTFVYQPLRDARGDVVGVIGYGFDVTGAVLARKAVEDESRAKDELLVALSHALRTPLNAIVGWAHLLRTDALDATYQRRALAAIERSARTQAQLLDEVLDHVRITSGMLAIAQAEVELVELVRVEVAALRESERDKRFVLDVPETKVAVRGDAERLRQALLHVLSNALEVTGPRGTIEVVLERRAGEAVLTIRDDGVGIAPAQLPTVFEWPRRPDDPPAHRSLGLGLGLAIARGLVELHGGRMSAHSEGLGLGASFRMHLPLA